MALSLNDKNEIKEIILGTVTGTHARTEAKFEIIDNKLDNINNHLTKMNGKLVKHDDQINAALIERAQSQEHGANFEKWMDNIPARVECLETAIAANKVTRKFAIQIAAVTSVLISTIFGVLKILEFFLT